MNKQQELNKIVREIKACRICIIGKSGVAVPGEGNPDADIVFIGEAPGKKEAVSGRPFIGRSGQLLRSLIREAGFLEEDVFITSPVKYLPNGPDGTPGGTPKSSDIAHGRIHLMKQFEIIQPKVVMLLGRVAAEGVLQKKVFVVTEHGQVIEERDGVKYFLTVHPAAALRFPNKYKPMIQEDFEKLKRLLNQ
ncbi:MAG TPA: uracil-DNA glycosylase [Candidatus Limnocylindrales bacterium]|nr:uracil-DNA glycosylase [Candidatus Limnocylindrales bacterium]